MGSRGQDVMGSRGLGGTPSRPLSASLSALTGSGSGTWGLFSFPLIMISPSVLHLSSLTCAWNVLAVLFIILLPGIFRGMSHVPTKFPQGDSLDLLTPEPELKEKLKEGQARFSKTKFTMLIPEVISQLESNHAIQHIVLFGIETHVCIQQTVIDLMERGYQVHIVADACSSRTQMDRTFAFERFRQSGAFVTTSDAILLQLIGDKDHQHFKAIQRLIMKTAPDSGL